MFRGDYGRLLRRWRIAPRCEAIRAVALEDSPCSEVITAICCPGSAFHRDTMCLRAIALEDSPCCGGPDHHQRDVRHQRDEMWVGETGVSSSLWCRA